MKLSVCPQPFYERGLVGALDAIADLGLEALELPVDRGSPLVDLDALLAGGVADLRSQLSARGLGVSAVSIHQEGQLLLGPHHADTDRVHAGSPAQKRAFAEQRLLAAARLAHELEVPVLVGFLGCEDQWRSFPWPDPTGWESMAPAFVEAVLPLLDQFAALGVSFAAEAHPKQFVYNTETALESVALLGAHPSWGFNFDPANLLLAGVDPVVFVAELGPRILHGHAKDGELVSHHAARSGLLAHGAWDRPGRGFRFRVPGWGDLDWKRLVSELIVQGYDGWLALEHEDPLFGPVDGLEKGLATLRPLLPSEPRGGRWW